MLLCVLHISWPKPSGSFLNAAAAVAFAQRQVCLSQKHSLHLGAVLTLPYLFLKITDNSLTLLYSTFPLMRKMFYQPEKKKKLGGDCALVRRYMPSLKQLGREQVRFLS